MFGFFKKSKLPQNAPKLLIIGAQKAGTTTLFDILNSSMYFNGSSIKEIHYFDQNSNFNKGDNWYFSFFKDHNKINFEATPAYLYYKKTPKRIYDTFGKKIKFIVLLRSPVERAYSQWNMFRKFNADKKVAHGIYENFVRYSNQENKDFIKKLLFDDKYPTFLECIENEIKLWQDDSLEEEPSFVRRGLYFEQIQNYLKYYDLDDFLFFDMSDLKENRAQMLNKIYSFMNMREIATGDINIQSNKGIYTEKKSTDTIESFKLLKQFYKPHNEELFKLIGKEYKW